MKYKIMVDPDEGFIRVTVYEAITGNLARDFATEAIAAAKQSGVLRFLVDVHGIQNLTDTIDQYKLSYNDMTSLGLDRTSKIAILVGEGDKSHNFIETVFRNAGYSCRLFLDEDNARNWLQN